MKANTESKYLPNSFFKENPLKEISTATIGYFTIVSKGIGELDQMIHDTVVQGIKDSRKEAFQRERQRIEQTDDPAELVEIMRKGHDILNQRLLCDRIIALHEQTMPLVLKRYRTCALDQFIDAATTIFALGEKKYAQMLREMYGDIRYPYSRACACLAFGIQKMEEEIPFLLNEYRYFQQAYPEKSYEQHPLLALYLLHGKYYRTVQK